MRLCGVRHHQKRRQRIGINSDRRIYIRTPFDREGGPASIQFELGYLGPVNAAGPIAYKVDANGVVVHPCYA